MAKYFMGRHGRVFTESSRWVDNTDTPVIVLPEADWREMVELWGLRFRGSDSGAHVLSYRKADRISAIIQRTEAENNA